MKIRNHRKKEWLFYPSKSSSLPKHVYIFKYKKDLMNFLNHHLSESVNGTVRLDERNFQSSYTRQEWFVWYNDYGNEKIKIVLKQLYFRGRKFVLKKYKISKSSKKYFAFSKKVNSLMLDIYEKDEVTILPNKAKNLINLFEKGGFEDFEPTEEDWEEINYYLENGIDFYYWSDRCNYFRCKIILEFFKKNNLL